jgi:hypothetical protein
MKRSVLVIAMLYFLGAGSVSASEVTVTFGVDPERTLPQLPITFHINIKNSASQAVRVPSKAVLQARQDDGRHFVVLAGSERTQDFVVVLGGSPTGLTLAAGESRDLTIFGDVASTWMCDTRVTSPGEYELQLILSDELQLDRGIGGKEDVLTDLGFHEYLLSSKATLRVDTPQGNDAAVYEMIKDTPCLWPMKYDRRIIAEHSASQYAAYVAPLPEKPTLDETITALEQAIGRGPTQVVSDRLQFVIAQTSIEKLSDVRDGKLTLDEAIKSAELAEKILRVLSKSAKDPALRAAAGVQLNSVPTRETLKRDADIAAGIPVEIVPTVSCIDNGHVWFGFVNRNRKELELSVGPLNQFTPAPSNQGQPTSFKPGEWDRVFSVMPRTPEVTWHLDKSNLIVKLRELKTCEEVDREVETKD